LIVLLVFTALLWGSLAAVQGQYSGRVRVHNPGNYHRTRTLMSRRAAPRKILKKKRHRAAKHRRHN
jgi:hypothetical protein